MAEICIPFLAEFKERMLSGQKTFTSRTKRYGREGDIFKAFGHLFALTAVYKGSLRFVANKRYLDEGFPNTEAFIEVWKRLHPRKGYDPNQTVWIHRFKKILV